ncbi:MAG: Uma2 family endonuclease [Firmicutes bacterium]|nr:Uma2 family endonuclease [Bacillota bacterium]
MPLPELKNYTIEDIYALPEGQRAELIDGQLYDMSPPNTRHQKLVSELVWFISSKIKENNGNCEIFPAPFAVFLNADNKTYVEPDISVICDRKKLNDKGCNGSPDWIIEIVSPNNVGHDYIKKLNLYSTSEVREYWIVDPQKEMTHVYNFENDMDLSVVPFNENIISGIFDDLIINMSELLSV